MNAVWTRLGVLMLMCPLWACGSDDGSEIDTGDVMAGDGDAAGEGGDGDDTGASPDGDTSQDGDVMIPVGGVNCDEIDTTWGAVQKVVFEDQGCTESNCHGDAAEGDLDLRADVAYENLVGVPSNAGVSMLRLLPGEQDDSLLWRKLAAKTIDLELPEAAGAPMPVGAGMLAEHHLEAVKRWIRGGAPEDGFVLGTEALFSCEEPPPPAPLKIDPLEAPEADKGVQFFTAGWHVEAYDEGEVCYATYYDIADQIPDSAIVPCTQRYGGPEQECVAFDRFTVLQDPQSHHLFVDVFPADASPDDPGFRGEFACMGGDHAGMACDPKAVGVDVTEGGADCGAGASCQSPAAQSVACGGWGPTGYQLGYALPGTGESRREYNLPEGVYTVLPKSGYVVWNSHAFNTTDQATDVGVSYNLEYAPPEDQKYVNERLSDRDRIFVMNVPPYQTIEYCETYTIPRYARLTALTSHTHSWGTLWRTWLPPNEPCTGGPENCMPRDDDPAYVNRDYSDPPLLAFSPPVEFDMEDEAERTFLFCAVFDNGGEDPTTLKRQSTSPANPCRDEQRYCVGGDNRGTMCGTDASVCTGGGVCDGCPVRGGVTTDDEMFILQGGYYLVPPEDEE